MLFYEYLTGQAELILILNNTKSAREKRAFLWYFTLKTLTLQFIYFTKKF